MPCQLAPCPWQPRKPDIQHSKAQRTEPQTIHTRQIPAGTGCSATHKLVFAVCPPQWPQSAGNEARPLGTILAIDHAIGDDTTNSCLTVLPNFKLIIVVLGGPMPLSVFSIQIYGLVLLICVQVIRKKSNPQKRLPARHLCSNCKHHECATVEKPTR